MGKTPLGEWLGEWLGALPLGSQPQGSQAMSNKAGNTSEVSNELPLRQIAAQEKEDAGSRSGCSDAGGSSRRSHHGGGEITRTASIGNACGSMVQNTRGVMPIPTRDRPKARPRGSVRLRGHGFLGGGVVRMTAFPLLSVYIWPDR